MGILKKIENGIELQLYFPMYQKVSTNIEPEPNVINIEI